MGLLFLYSTFFIIGAVFFIGIEGEPMEDKKALLEFLHKMNHSSNLNWDKKRSSICKTWIGVTCNTEQTQVIALNLPRYGFNGQIPQNTLNLLSALQSLNLASNNISGSFPSSFSQLKNLTHLFLQFNRFSGSLPSDFSVWNNLTILNLSNNGFNGSIPFSLSNLTHLNSLILSNNSLTGQIPDINILSLKELNLANNKLSGIVPKSLQRFPNWSFSGNNLSSSFAVMSTKRKKRKGLKEAALLGIIISGCVLGLVIISTFVIMYCYEKRGSEAIMSKNKKTSKKKELSSSDSRDGNKIVFFEDCNLVFDLEDLLRASAEVLGKGTFGTVYKAALEDSTTVAVKRLKEVAVGRREFEQQMEIVGRIRHENVAALRAYYYSKEEKLMVYDYYEQGSVSAMLHGKRGVDKKISLDWDSRLRIAIGTARGIAHIHTINGGKLIHGNIKSSNIFLNSKGYGCISDIGLVTMMSSIPSPTLRSSGYRALEVTDTQKATSASDIYSFGVLLLELLTGKSPAHATGGEDVVNLVRWVNSVVREEWTAEVFDVELLRYPNIEEEMVEMLQIGMACVVKLPNERPMIEEVVKMVEEIRRVHSGNRPSTESRSESSTPTPHGIETTSTSSIPY